MSDAGVMTKVIPHADLAGACEQGWELVELLHTEELVETSEWVPNPQYQVVVPQGSGWDGVRHYYPPGIDHNGKDYSTTDKDGHPSHLMARRQVVKKVTLCLVRRGADSRVAELAEQVTGALQRTGTAEAAQKAAEKSLAELDAKLKAEMAEGIRALQNTITSQTREVNKAATDLAVERQKVAQLQSELDKVLGKIAAQNAAQDGKSDAAARAENLEIG